ncbi:POK9 protein, partial [Nyctibius grandis]|nr:POK9 protein [Nyctibius grandis]
TGSLVLDVATAVACTLVNQHPQRIKTRVIGPMMISGQSCGTLLLGQSPAGLKGLLILPGLIDADFTGTISVVVQTTFPPIHIPAGSKIAQLIPLPQLTQGMEPLSLRTRGTTGFGSTGEIAMLTMAMNRRPVTSVTLRNGEERITLDALLDTGAYLTIVA